MTMYNLYKKELIVAINLKESDYAYKLIYNAFKRKQTSNDLHIANLQ